MFKPNLIPNSSPAKPINLEELIGNKRIKDYLISNKKDGCRVEIIEGTLKTRALKPVKSKYIQERYSALAKRCQELGVVLEGEYYCHDFKFNEILRFFNTEDILDPKHRKKLSNPDELNSWIGRDAEWLCSNHDELRIWIFDCFVIDKPTLTFKERMDYLASLCIDEFTSLINLPILTEYNNFTELKEAYYVALEQGWEGFVLTHKDSIYKFGRSTVRQGSIYKMKPDNNEYDGQIIDVEEGTLVNEDAETTVNELGRTVTSKKKDDRHPSGMAKSFLCMYEGCEISVSFQGFNHKQLAGILKDKDKYVGKWIKYAGMKPVKNVPRHAHFICFRDSKN